MESVYSIIPQPTPMAARAKMFRSQRHSTDPTYSTFGLHGTSVVVGNTSGRGAVSLHPRKKPFGAMGRVVSEDINPDTFHRRQGKVDMTRPYYNKNQRMEAPPEPPRRRVRGGSIERAASGRVGHDEGPHEGDAEGERAGSAPLVRDGPALGGKSGGGAYDYEKPPVPYRTEQPVMGLRSNRNYVVSNAVDAVLSVPKHPQPRPQRAVDLPTFGKVPQYLKQRAAETAASNAALRREQEAMAAKNERFRVMENDERQSMIDRLQQRAKELNRALQTLGFTLETQSQLRHREAIEKELKLVEAGIARLKPPSVVYVYDDRF